MLTAMNPTLTAGFATVPSLSLRELEANLVAVVVRDVVSPPLLRMLALCRLLLCLLALDLDLRLLVLRAVSVLGVSPAALGISMVGATPAKAALASSETLMSSALLFVMFFPPRARKVCAGLTTWRPQ